MAAAREAPHAALSERLHGSSKWPFGDERPDVPVGLGASVRLVGADKSAALDSPYVAPYTEGMRKTSVYLDDQQAEHLAALAREAGRPQAEILRGAIVAYRLRSSHDRSFALAAGLRRVDDDARPISEIREHELLDGFGA